MTTNKPESAQEGESGNDVVPQIESPSGTAEPEIVEVELVEELRALRATIDYTISGQSGLTPSQIAAIDSARPDLREVIIRRYDEAMTVETERTRSMTALTVKDQQDGVDLVRFGLKVLVSVTGALIAFAVVAVAFSEPGVAAAALGPVGVVAVGGVVSMALRKREK